MKTPRLLTLVSLTLLGCGGEPAPAVEVATPPTAEPVAPAPVVEAALPTPVGEAALPTPAAEVPSSGVEPDLSDPPAVCAAFYDAEVRNALARAEAATAAHPDRPYRTSLGVGERGAFIAGCSTLETPRLRCFTEYAATHDEECLAFILSPPPSLTSIAPLNNLTTAELAALAATLPPAL